MARVTYSPLVADIRGKAADVVFSSWKGRGYIRQRVTPANPQTGAQTAQRNAMSEAVAIWHLIPAAIRTGFAAGATGLNYSGYNDWCARNVAAIKAATGLMGPRRNAAAVAPHIETPVDFAYDSEPGAGTAQYTWTDPGQGADYRMGFAVYDSTLNTLGDVNANANLMSLEAQVLSHPVIGNIYLVGVWVYRVSDAELVHFGTAAHTQLS